MIRQVLVVGIATFVFGGGAHAQSCSCSGTQVTNGPGLGGGNKNLTNALSGNTVCVAKSGGGWVAQEEHRAGGELWDYKLGPSSTVDKTAKVGTWVISGTNAATAITYTYNSYTPNAAFTYTVFSNSATPGVNSTICFCGATTVSATIKNSGGGC
jgi:hypothetical protein